MTDKYYVYGRSTPHCEYCAKAKALLDEKRVPYEFIDLSSDREAKEWFLEAGFKKVPQVYFEDILIGGYNDLAAYFRKLG